ncbi:homoserine kinase [Ectobacillus antri]|jgi:homoserine kinase|uniref:Homoserine kinase n=1 Tax=Ectobacillus antri TaxID=2486280 RepID=A0ABT6H652_9BACI|nr:homoserine kinase [Ectobacillus antri]MDG4657697.1 homoserine kinase [Ectobacillus antri]MDG5754704.1 homoserine kinase [Ectobacillus antri]
MTFPMFTIQVPGSTANLGPGFDSIGLAISKYLHIDVYPSDSWHCEAKSAMLEGIPQDESNLLFQTALAVAAEYGVTLPYCHLEVTSDIPLARGLGSSASAIIAGIELTNVLCGLHMTMQEKLDIGSVMEGHMDNVGASLYGGLVVGTYDGQRAMLVHQQIHQLELVAIIPSYELKTSDARSVLPPTLSYAEAIQGSGVSNLLVAALLKEDWSLAGEAMKRDLFHQPYRESFIPELRALRTMPEHPDVYGYALSGAGPAVLCYVRKGAAASVQAEFAPYFSGCIVEVLQVVNEGSKVITHDETIRSL